MTEHEDGYDGPAELVAPDGVTVSVEVSLRGHFDPISGRYRWYGRVAAGDDVAREVARLVTAGMREVVLRTPHAEVGTALSDTDPWGRPRVEGFGVAPFPVLSSLPDDSPPAAKDVSSEAMA